MVKTKFDAGKSVYFIDMHTGYITLSDLSDGLHPTAGGFMKMARLYYDTLVRVTPQIKPVQAVPGVDDGGAPNDVAGAIDTKCQMDLANAVPPVVTQGGSGDTDGAYVHKGVDRGSIFKWSQTTNPSQTPNLSGIFWAVSRVEEPPCRDNGLLILMFCDTPHLETLSRGPKSISSLDKVHFKLPEKIFTNAEYIGSQRRWK